MSKRMLSAETKGGLAMMAAIILASFGVSEVMQRKYQVQDARHPRVSGVDDTALELLEAKRKSKESGLTLEDEYQRMMSKLDLDNWQQIRVPRPDGEDDDDEQQE